MVTAAKEFTINATGRTELPQAANSVVSRWLIQLVSASFVGSVTVKGRVTGKSETEVACTAIAYTDRSEDVLSTAAITGSALIVVDSAGLEAILDCTSYTSGSLAGYAIPLLG